MSRARRGCFRFAPDPMKPQAPGWRENYKKRVGRRRARWSVAGKPGRRRVCRWNRNQPSTETFKPFQPLKSLKSSRRMTSI